MGFFADLTSASFTPRPEHGYLILVLGAAQVMNTYLVVNVIKARKQYGVEYPALYADKDHKNAKEFNSVQRAHQNTCESYSTVMTLMLANGIVYPEASAAFGLIWVLGRVMYGYGYANGGPSGRMTGGLISHLGDLPLWLMCFFTGYKVLTMSA